MRLIAYIKSNLALKNAIKRVIPDFLLTKITRYKYATDAEFKPFYTEDGCEIRFHLGALEDNRGIGRVAKEQFAYMQQHLTEKRPLTTKLKVVHFYSSVHWCPAELPQNSVVMIHDVIPMVMPELFKPQHQEWRERFYNIAQQAKYIVTISQTSKQDIIKHLHIQEEKITIINNGVTALVVPKAIARELPKNYFVYLGSYDVHKNLDTILEALQRNKEFKLLMIGDNKESLKKVKELHIEEQVTFLGRLDDSETAFVIQNALAILFPSLYEGFGLPPMEAALLHTPAICSNRPTMNEFLLDVCLFADPYDVTLWAESMQKLFDDKKLRKTLAQKAHKRVSHFTWKKSSQQLLSLLKEQSIYLPKEQKPPKDLKEYIKSTPILGFAMRWFYNLLRINNTKHNLFMLQEDVQKMQEQLQEKQRETEEQLQSYKEQLQEQREQLQEQREQQTQTEEQLQQQIQEIQKSLTIIAIPNAIELETEDYLAKAAAILPHKEESLKEFDEKELYYSLFENVFYNHEVVLEKQKVYLSYIPEINREECVHLDIGCGRGEFLTILKEEKFIAKGIDINSLEIAALAKKGFDVGVADMIEYLENFKEPLSSISALQVIEHIEYDVLKKLITLSYEKLEQGGVIILETINPHNKVAFNSFYMDETHKRPLPPEMMAFMLQYFGFKDIKFVYTSPMPEEFRSNNHININYHDYAVVGYKL